ncbi:MAG: Xaa-Pro peptidase family protein [Candidatus Marsarchaeota archaeon]|nr:Xaa-Pro peptidase family protein [Candidatus Marsarchaeota archaeon]
MRFPFTGASSVLLFSGDVPNGPGPNFLQPAGADIDGAILVWTRGGKTLVTSKMNALKAEHLFGGRVLAVDWKDIGPTIKRLAPHGKVGLDLRHLRAERYVRLCKLLGKDRVVDAGRQLDDLRRVKSPQQIAKIAKAVSISKDILNSIELKPSMTELDVVRQLAIECAERNVSFAFPPIVAAGENAREPHHEPMAKKLGNGVVLIDFGAQYQHFNADLSRCYFLGSCKEEKKKYEEAKEIHDSILDEMPALHSGGELARFADRQCKKMGWGRMLHAIGHGLGLEVHDPPSLGLQSKEKLQDGVVLAIEPGWYGKKFGVRYENDVAWGKKKARLI